MRVFGDILVAQRQLGRRNGNDLLVLAGIVFHDKHADRPDIDDAARHQRARVADQHVDRIAIARQRVRHEAVIAGVAHRGVQKAVDEQRAGLLVHLILDRLAADRHFDDDVDVLRRILSDGYGFNAHGFVPLSIERR